MILVTVEIYRLRFIRP